MDLISKPNLPEFLPDEGEQTPPEPEPLPKPFQLDDEKRLPIKVVGGDNMYDLLLQAGHFVTLDFLVRGAAEHSFLGDYLLIGYVQLSAYLEFRKLGKTYKTEDPELFKHWLSLKAFGGPGKK